MNNLEAQFIAYMLEDPKYLTKVMNKIDSDYLPETFDVFKVIHKYYTLYNGIITEADFDNLFSKKKVQQETKVKFDSLIIEKLKFSEYSDAGFDSLLDLLREQRAKKIIIDSADLIVKSNINDLTPNNLDKLKTDLQQKLASLDNGWDDVKSEGEIGQKAKERWEEYKYLETHPDSLILFPTGFKVIDESAGGFAPGELIYIIGRKGDGKSTLILNLAYHLWTIGINTIIFSIEVSEKAYMRRFDSLACGIASDSLKRAKLTTQEKTVYRQYLRDMAEGKYNGKNTGKLVIVDVPGDCTPAFVENKVKEKEQEFGVEFPVVFLDYAGIMRPNISKKEMRHEKAEIAFELKQYARKYDKSVVTAEQMNRVGKNQKKTENDAIAESDAVADHIDWGIAIRSTGEDMGIIESFKTRDTAPFEVIFRKRYDIMKIEELEEVEAWDV